jgi:hypothetical protein
MTTCNPRLQYRLLATSLLVLTNVTHCAISQLNYAIPRALRCTGEAALALEALLGVFEHLADGKLTRADLATARASFLADRAAVLSSTRGTAQALADAFLNDLPDDFYETLESRVKQLTPDELRVAAQRYLRDAPMAIVVDGKHLALGGRPLLKSISDGR